MEDTELRQLAAWSLGWTNVRAIEGEITAVWAQLRALRVQSEEAKTRLALICPLRLEALAERFWSKVLIVDDEDSCWPWQKSRRQVPGEEYGLFRLDNETTIGAHRMAYALANDGEVPDHARHTCDNPPCCRPKHLLNGTHADNMRDKKERGRGRTKRDQRGEANGSAVLTDQIVLEARRRYWNGESQGQLAEALSVDRAALGYAIRGATWQHLDDVEPPITGRRNGSRLTEDDVRAIRQSAESAQTLGEHYGVTPANIYAIRRRKSWKHVN